MKNAVTLSSLEKYGKLLFCHLPSFFPTLLLALQQHSSASPNTAKAFSRPYIPNISSLHLAYSKPVKPLTALDFHLYSLNLSACLRGHCNHLIPINFHRSSACRFKRFPPSQSNRYVLLNPFTMMQHHRVCDTSIERQNV